MKRTTIAGKISIQLLWCAAGCGTLYGCCDKQQIPNHIQTLYSSAAKERNDAALALARCGAKANDAVPQLGKLLYDENVGVQSAAAYALRKIDTADARGLLKDATDRRNAKKG